MTAFRSKPVLVAGFSALLSGAGLLGSAPAFTQDYIDVEAEREAAQRNAAAESVPVYTSNTGVNTSPVQSSAQPAAPVSGYSQPGIKPYSGQTITAQPVDGAPLGTSGVSSELDVGSVVIQLQQLQEEVRRLNGIVEEQSAQIQRLKEQSLERYVDLDRRLADSARSATVSNGAYPATNPDGANGSAGVTAGSGVATEKPSVPVQPGEEAAYQSAYEFVKARSFDRAVDAFKVFLSDYPFGRYAPNAHYWLGELYLVISPPDPELARQSFKLLLDQYPDNAKVPDALYKLGKVQYLKGNRERSREYLKRVTENYPDHPAAQLAQDFIRENF